jgi:L-fuculose-phosphate aldolase
MLPEAVIFLGIIHTTKYASPSSPENAAAIRSIIGDHDGLVLQRHGSLTVGSSPLDAFFKTETLEQISRVTYMLRTLGAGEPMPPHQVEKLMDLRRNLGLAHAGEEAEFCEVCGVCHPYGDHQKAAAPHATEEELVAVITREIMARLEKV